VYPIPEQLVVPPTYMLYFVSNQFFTMDQLVINPIIVSVPTTIQIITNLPTHIPKGSNHQPLDGGQPKDSLKGSSLRGNLPGESPFNPPIGSFG